MIYHENIRKFSFMSFFNEVVHFCFIFLIYKGVLWYFHDFEQREYSFFELNVITSRIQLIYLIPLHIFFFILYSRKIPFFEKFRANNLPWSWEVKEVGNFSMRN